MADRPARKPRTQPEPNRASAALKAASRAKRDPVATRSRIVAAAERLFAERGYGEVSMPQIAAASGVTAGAIYKHFEGKADLFFEVVRRAVVATPGAPSAIGPDVAGLAALVAGYTASRARRLRQMAVEVHYASARHPAVRRLLRRAVDGQIDDIADGVRGAQAAGEIDPSLDADLAGAAVMTFIMGLMHAETLTPRLVGDRRWRAFVEARIAAMLQVGGAGRPAP